MIFLDRASETEFIRTNVASQERKRMPPGLWEAVWEEEGDSMAFVGGESGDIVLVADQVFDKTIFEHPESGELFALSTPRRSSSAPWSTWSPGSSPRRST